MSDPMTMSLYVNVAFLVLAAVLGYNIKSESVSTKVTDPLLTAVTAWCQVVPALIVVGLRPYTAQHALIYGAGLYILGNIGTGILSQSLNTGSTGECTNKGCDVVRTTSVQLTNIGGSLIAGSVVLAVRGESLFGGSVSK